MMDIILLPFKRGHFEWSDWLLSVIFWTVCPLLLIMVL